MNPLHLSNLDQFIEFFSKTSRKYPLLANRILVHIIVQNLEKSKNTIGQENIDLSHHQELAILLREFLPESNGIVKIKKIRQK